MENLQILQKNYSYLSNVSFGSTSGQTIMWKSSLYELTSSVATQSSIIVVVSITGTNNTICVTNIYAPHKLDERIKC